MGTKAIMVRGRVLFRKLPYTTRPGIQVNADWTYNASFYYKFPATSSFDGVATVSLQSATGEVYASASVQISGLQTKWNQVAVCLKPTSSPASTDNIFTVTFDATDATGLHINFAMFSLFPPTFNGRANGLRIDIATVCTSTCDDIC